MSLYRKPPRLPELLAPAGSPEALEAAILAGADAVYLGGSRFNARMNAHNFDTAALREAVTHAHRMGSRVYLTLNTLVWDRELPDALEAAYEAASAGVDALIIADMGAAALFLSTPAPSSRGTTPRLGRFWRILAFPASSSPVRPALRIWPPPWRTIPWRWRSSSTARSASATRVNACSPR